MPIYEYYCSRCNRIYQFLIRDSGKKVSPACPKCQMENLEKRFSTFSTRKNDDSSISDIADDPMLAGVDENDPRSMARALRRMTDELGEDMGPEFNEALARLEAGEDPEQIERELEEAGFGDSASPSYDSGLYEP